MKIDMLKLSGASLTKIQTESVIRTALKSSTKSPYRGRCVRAVVWSTAIKYQGKGFRIDEIYDALLQSGLPIAAPNHYTPGVNYETI